MGEEAIRPFRAAVLVLLSAGALAGVTLIGLQLGHPFLGALGGYVAYLVLATRAFRSSIAGADDVIDEPRELPGSRLASAAR